MMDLDHMTPEDAEVVAHRLVNGMAPDGHPYSQYDLDRVYYTSEGSYTLRETLAEQADYLTEVFELGRVPKSGQYRCDACGLPVTYAGMCDRCEADDNRTFGADPARLPTYSPGEPNG